jgi:hypothetical protein
MEGHDAAVQNKTLLIAGTELDIVVHKTKTKLFSVA